MSMPTTSSGYGWIVPAVFVTAAVGGLLASRAVGIEDDSQRMHWPFVLALFLGAAVVLTLGRRWRRARGLLVWDARRERLTHLPAGHTFLWIDVEIWGWVLVAYAFRAFVAEL